MNQATDFLKLIILVQALAQTVQYMAVTALEAVFPLLSHLGECCITAEMLERSVPTKCLQVTHKQDMRQQCAPMRQQLFIHICS